MAPNVDTVSVLTITVNHSCSRCMKRIRKDISKLQNKNKIQNYVEYDDYNNTVKILGFNPNRIVDKLHRKACRSCKHTRKITFVDKELEEEEDEEGINGPPPSPVGEQEEGMKEEEEEEEEEEEQQQQQRRRRRRRHRRPQPLEPDPSSEPKPEPEPELQQEAMNYGYYDWDPSQWTYDYVPHVPSHQSYGYSEEYPNAACTIL